MFLKISYDRSTFKQSRRKRKNCITIYFFFREWGKIDVSSCRKNNIVIIVKYKVGVFCFSFYDFFNIIQGYFRDEDSIIKTHRALLEAGIYILEDCALGDVPAGDYELLCLPLLLYKGDAAPCRAILRPLK